MNYLKVNLEEKLVKQNEKRVRKELEVTDQLLSQVNSILENSAEEDRELLMSCGMTAAINHAQSLKEKKERLEKDRKRLNKRVFSREDIKKVAVDYGLRFLPTRHYKGSFPADLASDIRKAQEEIGIDNIYESYEPRYYTDFYNKEGTCYILAPKSSFNLKVRPKDPLFFMRLKDDSYYLVKKWGNDLNIWRWLANFPFRNSVSFWSFFMTLFFSVFYLTMTPGSVGVESYVGLVVIDLFLAFICTFVVFSAHFLANESSKDQYNEDKWDSNYK